MRKDVGEQIVGQRGEGRGAAIIRNVAGDGEARLIRRNAGDASLARAIAAGVGGGAWAAPPPSVILLLGELPIRCGV